jgi:hypothetical protein
VIGFLRNTTNAYTYVRVWIFTAENKKNARFEVFTAVTMKNGVFWVVTPCGS